MQEVKLINGKWYAVFENTTDLFSNLSDVQRKLFAVLIDCERILVKHNIKLPENEPTEITPRRLAKNLYAYIKRIIIKIRKFNFQKTTNSRFSNFFGK